MKNKTALVVSALWMSIFSLLTQAAVINPLDPADATTTDIPLPVATFGTITQDYLNSKPHVLVWEVADTAVGGFVNTMDTLTFTKTGPYKDDLELYSSDLTTTLVDSEGTMRYTATGGVLAGRGNTGSQTLTMTFSDPVKSFGMFMTATRQWNVDIYDAAVGGNLMDSFSVTGVNNSLVGWSATGGQNSVGRAVFTRVDSSGDYRISFLAVEPVSIDQIPEPSALGLLLLGGMVLRSRLRKAKRGC